MKTPEINRGFSENQMVRRERDSNPRSDKSETAFRVRRIQPDSAISPVKYFLHPLITTIFHFVQLANLYGFTKCGIYTGVLPSRKTE